MTFFKNLKNQFLRGARANFSLAIYAIIIAVLAWFIISMTLYPSVPLTINNVGVTLDISGTSAGESGLSVISCDVESVDIQIKGSRTQVGNLNSDSFVAYIDTSNISTPGKKTLAIKIRSSSNVAYEVESISPATATVVLDKYETLENVPVTPKIPNITYAADKTIDEEGFGCEPGTVSIYGPSAQLEKIAKCYAVTEKEMVLDSSYNLVSDEIQLVAEDGTIIDQKLLTINPGSFQINIPVLTQKEVGLTVRLVNMPQGFDEQWLTEKLKLSEDSLTIASKSGNTSLSEVLEIGRIKLSDVGLDFSKSYNVTSDLESVDIINRSGPDTITVTLDSTGLAQKEITLSKENIHISNKPADDYDYNLATKSLPVTIIGPEDVIEDITANDIYAEANLLNAEIQGDEFTYDVTLTCPSSDKVWAVRKSMVYIQRVPKPTEASTEAETDEDDETTSETDAED